MPEIAVAEHRDLCPRKDNVRTPRQVPNGYPEPQASSMERAPKQHFAISVSLVAGASRGSDRLARGWSQSKVGGSFAHGLRAQVFLAPFLHNASAEENVFPVA